MPEQEPFIGTPAPNKVSEPPQTLAIDDKPLDSCAKLIKLLQAYSLLMVKV